SLAAFALVRPDSCAQRKKQRKDVRWAFALVAFFLPPRALVPAASLAKNSATIAGVIASIFVGRLAAVSQVISATTWRWYWLRVCSERPSARSWTWNCPRASWRCMPHMQPWPGQGHQGAFSFRAPQQEPVREGGRIRQGMWRVAAMRPVRVDA